MRKISATRSAICHVRITARLLPCALFALLSALPCAPALFAFSAPLLQSPVLSARSSGTHAENVYGHYAGMPQSLSGLIAPGACRGGELCVTRSGSGATPATTRYNAYVYSKSNPSGRISASYVVDGSKTLVSGFSLAYRTDGQVASKETFAASGDGMTCERTVYGYDALGRLSSEDRTSCGAAALPQSGTTDLSYDASGNTVSERAGTGALTTTTYTGRDRIRAHCTGTACRHPRYGARGGILGDGSERFVYTDEARLSSRYAGSQGKAYRYLPDGLLWETQAGGASGVYLYRAGDELSGRARLESSGVEETSHNFWFEGLDARTVTHDGSASGFDYGFSDYMGSVLTETDGHGETRGLRRYGHAGDPLSSPGAQGDAPASWPLGYSEGYEDRLGGAHALTFFGVREQEGGRFLEADTDWHQPNAYVYAADNWPNRVDMTGHAAEPVFAGEGVYGESSSGTDLPTCDELNPDCQMPALPDEGGGNDNGGGTERNGVSRYSAGMVFGYAATGHTVMPYNSGIIYGNDQRDFITGRPKSTGGAFILNTLMSFVPLASKDHANWREVGAVASSALGAYALDLTVHAAAQYLGKPALLGFTVFSWLTSVGFPLLSEDEDSSQLGVLIMALALTGVVRVFSASLGGSMNIDYDILATIHKKSNKLSLGSKKNIIGGNAMKTRTLISNRQLASIVENPRKKNPLTTIITITPSSHQTSPVPQAK